MPVPRPPIRIAAGDRSLVTAAAAGEAERSISRDSYERAFAAALPLPVGDLHGFVAKSRSPSCGFGDSREFVTGANPVLGVHGVLTEWLLETSDRALPIATERQLTSDAELRGFLERCAAFAESPRRAPRTPRLGAARDCELQ
jgi:uncharacterized protein YbbK (DUF523 family)